MLAADWYRFKTLELHNFGILWGSIDWHVKKTTYESFHCHSAWTLYLSICDQSCEQFLQFSGHVRWDYDLLFASSRNACKALGRCIGSVSKLQVPSHQLDRLWLVFLWSLCTALTKYSTLRFWRNSWRSLMWLRPFLQWASWSMGSSEDGNREKTEKPWKTIENYDKNHGKENNKKHSEKNFLPAVGLHRRQEEGLISLGGLWHSHVVGRSWGFPPTVVRSNWMNKPMDWWLRSGCPRTSWRQELVATVCVRRQAPSWKWM